MKRKKKRKSIPLTSSVCLQISLVKTAATLPTFSSGCAMCTRTAGKTSASTTASARSAECLAILLSANNAWRCKGNVQCETRYDTPTCTARVIHLRFGVRVCQGFREKDDCTRVHYRLRKFDTVLAYVADSRRGDLLNVQLGLLQTQYEELHRA